MPDFKIYHPSDVPIGQSEIVLKTWTEARGDKFAPAWHADFRLEHLPNDVIPNISVVDVIDGGKDYLYRFWGTNNTNRKSYEMSGKYLTQSPTKGAIEIGYQHFGWIVENREPFAAIFHPVYISHFGNTLVTYRFPLSSDGITVDKILTYQPLDIKREVWERAFEELQKSNR